MWVGIGQAVPPVYEPTSQWFGTYRPEVSMICVPSNSILVVPAKTVCSGPVVAWGTSERAVRLNPDQPLFN